jgi:CRP-like cAMP-binding protein
VLAALPESEIKRLHGLMNRVLLKRDQVLHEVGERVEVAYFLCDGLVSLTLTCQQGVDFELGVVGREGVVGEREVLADGVAVVRSQVQMAGSAYVLPMDILRAEFRRGGPLQDAILRQVHSRLIETSQVALCNHLHGMEEKLCRWLLTIYDRACTPDLPLTQEFIARMLATRRSGVTVAAGTLRKSGLIDYTRGHIKILDPLGLERSACECYRVIKAGQKLAQAAHELVQTQNESPAPLSSQFEGTPDLDGYQPPLQKN